MKSLILALVFSTVAATANAQVIYNSRVAYDVAHPGNYVIDFNNAPPAPPSISDFTATTPFGNVGFDAIPSNLNIEFLGNNNFPFLGPNNLALYAFNGQFLTDSLAITLPANTFSFGVDLISPSGTVDELYKLTILSNATPLAILSLSLNSGYTFIGFDSLTGPITSINVQISNGVGNPEPTIDNFTIVPEPSTWASILIGGATLLVWQRRRARR